MQFAVVEPLLDLGDRRERAGGIGKVDLDVILRPHLPGAILGEWVARAGDDAPTGGRKSLHRGMTDAAARSRQQESASRLVRLRRHHEVKSQKRGRMLEPFALRWKWKPLHDRVWRLWRKGLLTVGKATSHGYSRVFCQGVPGASRRNSIRSCSRNGRSCQNSITSGCRR